MVFMGLIVSTPPVWGTVHRFLQNTQRSSAFLNIHQEQMASMRAAAMGGIRGAWLTVGAASPKRVSMGARAMSGGARSARAGADMFPVFQGKAGVIESNDMYVVAAETEEAHSAQIVWDAGSAKAHLPRELLFVPSQAEQHGSAFAVVQGQGGVVESNDLFITAAETEEATVEQSMMYEGAARQLLPRELFFVPSETTPLIFDSPSLSPSSGADQTKREAGAKTIEVNGMRFFVVDDAAPAAGGHFC